MILKRYCKITLYSNMFRWQPPPPSSGRVEHVACMVWQRNVCRILSDNQKERNTWKTDQEMNVNKFMPGGQGLGSSGSG